MTDKRTRKILELKKRRIRLRRLHIALALFCVCAVIFIAFQIVSFVQDMTAAAVELSAQDVEILQ